MKVSIVIPVFNQLEYTKLCIESLEKNTADVEHEVIVVDNGSTDGTEEYFKGKSVKYIRNRENTGVAAAWNKGIRASEGGHICLLNNDVVVSKGWLSALLEFYEKMPDAGIVSPGTRWGDMNYDFEKYAAVYVKKMRNVSIRWYSGWCMLIKRDRFDKAGFFGEEYKIGTYEDTDFYYSLNKAGFTSYVAGCSFIHHFGNRTLKVMRRETAGFEEENRRRMLKKWGLKPETYVQVKFKSLTKFMRNLYFKVFYGHTLDEKRRSAG